MTSQLFDAAHVLVQHIDLMLAKAESIRMFVFPTSTLSKEFLSRDGKSAYEAAENLIKNKDLSSKKMSKSNIKFLQENQDKILQIAHSMDYIKTWCVSARTVMFKMAESSVDFNLKWNNTFTTIFLKLFVAFSKASLFIYMLPTIKIAVYCAPYCPAFNRGEFSSDILDVKTFINRASGNPFDMLIPKSEKASKDDKGKSEKGSKDDNAKSEKATEDDIAKSGKTTKYDFALALGQLLSQAGPYVIQALGQWPLINWDRFNPFTKSRTQSHSTYLDLEHLCLAHLPLIREATVFFCLTFPKFVEDIRHFKAIMIAVCSETTGIFLTRQFQVQFKDLFNTYDPKCEKINIQTRNIIARYATLKQSITHAKRISSIDRLINDMTNIASYNPNYISQFLYDYIALTSFGAYELDCILTAQIAPKAALRLLSTLVNSCKVFSKYQAIISRTFAYNIATLDSSFLNALISNAGQANADWQKYFIDQAKELCNILTVVDLEEIDNGACYDATSFLVTHGRLCTYFNNLKTKEKASHLQTIMEHLEAVRMHMNFMMEPVETFVTYCPIHQIWRHITYLGELASDLDTEADAVGCIMMLFPYFNLDQIALYQSQGELQRIQQQLQNIRANILKRVYSQLNEYISKTSKYQSITKQNQFEHIFDPTEFIINQKCDYEKEEKYKNPIWQLRTMMLNMPGAFTFGNTEVACAKYIGEAITHCIASILFSEPILDPQWVDSSFSAATQFMWPLFALIGAPFTQKILQCKYEHSCNENQVTFLGQVANLSTPFKLSQPNPETVAKLRGTTQLITIFQKYVLEFLEKESVKFKYYPHSRSFENEKDSTETAFFAYRALCSLVENLGPQGMFNIDWILITHATQIITKLYKYYNDNSPEIASYFADYQKGGNSWVKYASNSKILDEVGSLIINLGATMTVRKLLREAMRDYCEITLPGFYSLVNAAISRIQNQPNERESLIIEILSSRPFFHYIATSIDKTGLIKTTDALCFFFFLSLSMALPKWKTIMYDPETEYITYNFHLYPAGLDCILNVLPSLSNSNDQRDVTNGMSLFFDIASKVVVNMRNDATQTTASISAYIIMIDLFPRTIKAIEYGRITKNFPPSIVSEAFRNAADYNFHSIIRANTAQKKRGKTMKSLKKKSRARGMTVK